MNDQPVVIVGAGGFGRETADVLAALNRPIRGVVDDAPSPVNLQRLADRNISYLGPLSGWLAREEVRFEFLIGIGNPRVKEKLAHVLEQAGFRPAIAVHPSAVVGVRSTVGPGSILCSGAVISTNCALGRHVHVNPNVTVGHDTILDDYVSVNPSATIGGEVRVGAHVLLGSAANVLQRRSIGSDTVVGASALVTKDVPANVVVKGVPGIW